MTREQLAVVVDRVLPGELATRGVDDIAAVRRSLHAALAAVVGGASAESPEAVFRRLGG